MNRIATAMKHNLAHWLTRQEWLDLSDQDKATFPTLWIGGFAITPLNPRHHFLAINDALANDMPVPLCVLDSLDADDTNVMREVFDLLVVGSVPDEH